MRQHPEREESSTDVGKSYHSARARDIAAAVQGLRFVTLSFDRPQTVRHLPQWRWSPTRSYNGFSGGDRIRGWQLIRLYQANGWLSVPDVCSVTGQAGGTQLHNEDYSRPWDPYPVSKRAHMLIHGRARFTKAWSTFLATEALPDTWAAALAPQNDTILVEENFSARKLLDRAPHPDWVVVPFNEFDPR
jgi:hypothetical protein